MESFQFAMFCLLVLMCFGEKLDEKAILEIEVAQRNLLLNARKLNIFAFVPRLAQYLFRKRLSMMVQLRQRINELYVPLIRARRAHKRTLKDGGEGEESRYVFSYLDSLLDVELPEGRGLTDDEMVSLCSEFLNAGTDTTSTALQWIMAELVRHPEIQKKLVEEVESVVGREANEVSEEELAAMPYLKAVVKEGLRRHPPGHFVLPHAVTEELEIGGYVIPKGASVNFMVAEMNMDKTVWDEPMEFRPERFVSGGEGEGVDITGSKEVRMMPFGVGRRICPGLGLAMLHLEYFVANLVREFEWKTVEGEEVDMAEKVEFTVVMKNPLRASLVPRRKV